MASNAYIEAQIRFCFIVYFVHLGPFAELGQKVTFVPFTFEHLRSASNRMS